VAAELTPSQTVGPFFKVALLDVIGPEVVPSETPGAIRIHGRVFDGAGEPVPDALVEIWHANAAGRYAHPDDPRDDLALDPGFTGFGRSDTVDGGRFEFVTVKPAAIPPQAPHIAVSVFARGLLDRVVTRIYFPDEAEANAADPLLASLAPAERETLVAVAEDGALRFDVHLQGERQTTFLAV
jgi:protocatechuate 3,4-dioxygenase alpha subunit